VNSCAVYHALFQRAADVFSSSSELCTTSKQSPLDSLDTELFINETEHSRPFGIHPFLVSYKVQDGPCNDI